MSHRMSHYLFLLPIPAPTPYIYSLFYFIDQSNTVLLFSSHDYLALSRFLAFNQLAPDLTVSNKCNDVAASIWINMVPTHGYSFSRRHLKYKDTLHYKN